MLRSYDHRNGRTYTYHYDFKGRLAAKTCSDGTRLNYTYDDRDYLLSSARQLGDFKLNQTYLYGDGTTNKKLKSQVYGMTAITGAGTTLFSASSLFDKLDRLSTRTLTGGAYTQTTDYAYEWGTTLPQSVTVNGSTVSYTYDAAGNITSITDGSLITYYAYDSLNQLIREDNAYSNKTVVYTYDNGGNILSRMEYPYSPTVADITTLTPTNTVTYAYGNADWKDQLTSFNGEAITYDAIGNPLTYRGMTLTWQNGRQLSTLENGNTSVSYQYNEEGLRIGKTVNGVTTEYYWNGSQLLGQKTGTSLLHFLYDERGLLVGFNDGTKTYLYTRNLQGDIVSITDTATEQTVATYTYDSWGNILTATGVMANVNPFRYRGYYYDAEIGLYYLQSRYYDAEVGRFLNIDSLLITNNIVGYNLYAYCGNNPVNNVDPSGHFWGVIIAAVAITVGCCAALTGCTSEENKTTDKPAIMYDVPLYNQGNLNLCWAYCQTMIEAYRSGIKYNQNGANQRAKEIAISKHGKDNWNQGGWPSNLGEAIGKENVNSIEDLYSILDDNGPVYGYYSNPKQAHLVIITGVDLNTNKVYTNNPWGVRGVQSFEDFQKGFAKHWWQFSSSMPFSAIYLIN